jgi:MFS family permease
VSVSRPVQGFGLRHLLALRGFRLLFGVRLLGQFGDGMVQAALATFVLFSPEHETSATKIATAFAILLLPYSLIGPFVGVFIDRWSRRQILVIANLSRAAVLVLVTILVANGHDDGWLAVTVLVALGINRFVLSSLSASLPHVVEREYLVSANSLVPTLGTLTAALGGLIGVAIRREFGGSDHGAVAALGVAVVIIIGAGLLALAIGRRQLGPPSDADTQTSHDVVVGLINGLVHLRHRRRASRAIVIVVIHRFVFGALLVDALILMRTTYNTVSNSEGALADFTVLTGVTAAGALLAAVSTPWVARRRGEIEWSALALMSSGALMSLALLWSTRQGLLIAGFALGFAGQAVKICSDTIVQEDVDDAHLGRVFSVYDVVLNIGLVAGMVVVAFAAPVDGVWPLGQAGAGLVLIVTGLLYERTQNSPVPTATTSR